MERQCIVCGDRLVGRSDKKFCSDSCRNTHNNALKQSNNNLIRNVNNQLRKNHRILEAINTDNKTKTTKARLMQKGFSFDYFTGIYTTKAGATYFFVYDQGYLPLENDFYLLVKREGFR